MLCLPTRCLPGCPALPCSALLCPCCAEIWLNNIRYAMIEQLRRPRPGFEAPVRAHFRLLRWRIMRQCAAWMEQAQALDLLFQVCSTHSMHSRPSMHKLHPATWPLLGCSLLTPTPACPALPAEAAEGCYGRAARPAGSSVRGPVSCPVVTMHGEGGGDRNERISAPAKVPTNVPHMHHHLACVACALPLICMRCSNPTSHVTLQSRT
jgi:hypothetical protein